MRRLDSHSITGVENEDQCHEFIVCARKVAGNVD